MIKYLITIYQFNGYWQLGFNARAEIFQLYSGDMIWIRKWTWDDDDDEMKKGMEHKDNKADKFWLPLEKGREG